MKNLKKNLSYTTTGFKIISKNILEMVIVLIILAFALNPKMISLVSQIYISLQNQGESWIQAWILISPLFIIVSIMLGLGEYLLISSKQKKASKK